jgi:uncharacterized protein with HEPN domain
MIERGDRILANARDEDDFLTNTWVQDAVLRNLEVIGEAAKGVSGELRAKHPEVPWREAAAFRDFVAHAYDKVTPARVWAVVADELPALLAQLRDIAAANKW